MYFNKSSHFFFDKEIAHTLLSKLRTIIYYLLIENNCFLSFCHMKFVILTILT